MKSKIGKTVKSRALRRKEIVAVLKCHKAELSQKYGVKTLALFGSFLKGKEQQASDLDFLVSFEHSTFDNYMGLKEYLERLFKRKVDLVTESSLKPALRYVKAEAAYV